MELKVFYLHQSHAKNHWQTVATVCVFLASKVEETPRSLDKVIFVFFKMIHGKDSSSVQTIHQKEVFRKQKDLILIGERLLLDTIKFDLNVENLYKPLVAAIKKLKLQQDMMRISWNFVNEWVWTTLRLQYKPHYIASGSLYLAAKLNKVELPSQQGSVWWHEFDVVPQQLQGVIQDMMQEIYLKRTSTLSSSKAAETSSADSVLRNTFLEQKPASRHLPEDEVGDQRKADDAVPLLQYHTRSKKEKALKNSPVENGIKARDAKEHARTKFRKGTSDEIALVSVSLNKPDIETIRAKLKRSRENKN